MMSVTTSQRQSALLDQTGTKSSSDPATYRPSRNITIVRIGCLVEKSILSKTVSSLSKTTIMRKGCMMSALVKLLLIICVIIALALQIAVPLLIWHKGKNTHAIITKKTTPTFNYQNFLRFNSTREILYEISLPEYGITPRVLGTFYKQNTYQVDQEIKVLFYEKLPRYIILLDDESWKRFLTERVLGGILLMIVIVFL